MLPEFGSAVELTTTAGVLVCCATGTSLVELGKSGVALSAVNGALLETGVGKEDSLVMSAMGPTKPAVKFALCSTGAVLATLLGVLIGAGVGVVDGEAEYESGVEDMVGDGVGALIELLELGMAGLVFKVCNGVLVPGMGRAPAEPAPCELFTTGMLCKDALTGLGALSCEVKVFSVELNEGVAVASETGVEVDGKTPCEAEEAMEKAEVGVTTLGVDDTCVSIGVEDGVTGGVEDAEGIPVDSAGAASEDGMTTTG